MTRVQEPQCIHRRARWPAAEVWVLSVRVQGPEAPDSIAAAFALLNQFTGVDVILSSHKHSDHLDPGTLPGLMAASPRARLALPAALLDHAMSLSLPPDRLVGLNAGDLISEVCLAIEMGADATDIGKTIHPHPTLGESVGMAAELYEGVCTDLPPQRKK